MSRRSSKARKARARSLGRTHRTHPKSRWALDCGHCGWNAIFSADRGEFGEDDGEACLSCGIEGHVAVCDYDEPPTAWWRVTGERCTSAECTECTECQEAA